MNIGAFSSDGLSIVIDVGGGSTDIGYWTRSELKDQVSLKLAGNDVLTEHIIRQEPFVRALREACGLETDENVIAAFLAKPTILINHTFSFARRLHGGAFDSRNPFEHPVVVNMKGRGEYPWLPIRSLAYLFFTGVMFFCGLQARKYCQKRRTRVVKTCLCFLAGEGLSC